MGDTLDEDKIKGQLIEASHVNDIIVDGQKVVNTNYHNIQGTETITSTRHVIPVRIIAPDSGGIVFYASDGVTQTAKLDENGNLLIKGRITKL